MEKPRIHVILGSIREGRFGEKVANWFMQTVQDHPDAEFELVDLKDYALPMFADAITPSSREGIHPIPEVQKWIEKVDEADGYIFVTPEYNYGYSAVLKNALDYPFKEWHNKPVGFVSYGAAAGGARAVDQLRQVVAQLRLFDVLDHVLIPAVWTVFNADGQMLEPDRYNKQAHSVANAVATLAIQLKK